MDVVFTPRELATRAMLVQRLNDLQAKRLGECSICRRPLLSWERERGITAHFPCIVRECYGAKAASAPWDGKF